MREKIALAVCWLTVAVVAGLSYLFAVRHNPEVVAEPVPVAVRGASNPPPTLPAVPPVANLTEHPAPSPAVPPAEADRGRIVFGQQGCTTCHSIGGSGNPRHPLEGTGARWNAEELRQWICGTGVAAEKLSAAVRGRKQRYQDLPAEDLKLLVVYLSGLTQVEK